MTAAFDLPSLLRGRRGGRRGSATCLSTVRVEVDIPTHRSSSDPRLAYALPFPRARDGFNQIWRWEGNLYDGCLEWVRPVTEAGWPDGITEPRTLLYRLLWEELADRLFEEGGEPEGQYRPLISAALYGGDRSAWSAIRERVEGFRRTGETEEDEESVRREGSRILRGLSVLRGEVHLRASRPCFVVSVGLGRVRISISSTAEHERMRKFGAGRVPSWPLQGVAGAAGYAHCFAIEDGKRMLEFAAGHGALSSGRTLHASVWEGEQEDMNALELDRVARMLLVDVGNALTAEAPGGRDILALRCGDVFAAYFGLKEVLDSGLDPETAASGVEERMERLLDLAVDRKSGGRGIVGQDREEFYRRALEIYVDRPVYLPVNERVVPCRPVHDPAA